MTKIKIAIFSTLVAIGLHAYLAWNYYPLKFARSAGESLCNINATFNCDAVAASSFSSFLGIPMALWGSLTNIIFLISLLIYALRLTENNDRNLRNSFYLAFFIFSVSIVMGAVSALYIQTFCLFCIGTYICSLIAVLALWGDVQLSWQNLKEDLLGITSNNKSFLALLISIPVLSFILHKSMLRQFGAERLQQVINSSLFDWDQNRKHEFDVKPSLSMGPEKEDAKLVISEFADFLCGHCKHAAPSLHAFSQSHPDVRLEFYSFALDGECNEVVSRKVGAPCVLAKAVYCSGTKDNGWQVHDLIFSNQAIFFEARSVPAALEKLKELVGNISGDWEELKTCIDSDQALEAVKQQGKMGDKVGVKGTPSIYANGKKLPRGQLIPVLEGLYRKLK